MNHMTMPTYGTAYSVIPNTSPCDCQSCSSAGLERVHYFPGQLMTANEMTVEQNYFRQKLRRHNRFLHGWGVVCGLIVSAAGTETKPWQVSISCGYALSPQGDEIDVTNTICFDLAKCGPQTDPNPCEPCGPPLPVTSKGMSIYLAIRYAECETRPVRVHPAGCGCDEIACEYSRIRDDFQIGCLLKEPKFPLPDLPCELIARKQLPACLPCIEEPWVVLAKVLLPEKSTEKIATSQIDNLVRRTLYSTAMIQEQMLACCCDKEEEREPEPQPGLVTVTGVAPIAGDLLAVPPSVITIKFNKFLDSKTLTTQSILVQRGTHKVLGEISDYHVPTGTVTFTISGAMAPGTYEIRVLASGPSRVLGAEGEILDGDNNGKGGDDFVSHFSIQSAL